MPDQARPEITEELGDLIRGMIASRVAVERIHKLTRVSRFVVGCMVVEAYNQECEAGKHQHDIENGRRGQAMSASGEAKKRRLKILKLHSGGMPRKAISDKLGISRAAVSSVVFRDRRKKLGH
jgi:DNA-binding NarL/FixJ family response regulator